MFRMPSLRRALVVGVATLAALPLAAGAASAGELTLTDARGDMWTMNPDTTSDVMYVPAPNAKNGDFIRSTFRLTAKRVTVVSKFVDVAKVGKYDFSMRMRDQNTKKHIVDVRATPRNRAGSATLSTYSGSPVDCTVSHKIDYDRNTVRVSFPAKCIGTPRYLQFTALDFIEGKTTFWIDNPHHEKAIPRGWTTRVRRG